MKGLSLHVALLWKAQFPLQVKVQAKVKVTLEQAMKAQIGS
jgi:hypothetical protein